MNAFTCYHCGKTIYLSQPPDKDRKCSHCGYKLHVCQNCQFFDSEGCVLGDGQPFTAAHGTLCDRFQFKMPVARAA